MKRRYSIIVQSTEQWWDHNVCSPVSTIQRRRKQLEKEYLELSYTLLFEKFGSRRVDLLISTNSSKTDTVANRLLTREVVYVGKSIGELTIDLRAEIIIKDKAELSNVLEEAKAMDVVHDTGMERDWGFDSILSVVFHTRLPEKYVTYITQVLQVYLFIKFYFGVR